MEWLANLKVWNWPVLWGIFIFFMHRLMLLRNGPPFKCKVLSVKCKVDNAGAVLQTRRVEKVMNTKKLFVGVIMAIFTFTLCTNVFAQENRILMTTDQQYQNMVANADFETWNAGVTTVPDGWSLVSTPTVAQETTAPKLGATSLKITANAGQGISQTLSVEKNTTYTVSFYYKVVAGDHCTFSLTGSNAPGSGAFSLTGAAALDSATWTRKSFTITTNANDTALTLKMLADADGDIFYLDGITVTAGRGIPAFARTPVTDSGSQTIYGDFTVEGTTNLNGDVNLGDNLAIDTITLKGTLTSPAAAAVSIKSTTGVLQLNKASVDNELRVFENATTPTAYTSLRHLNLTTSTGNLTINPAGGTTNVTGALAVSTTVTATGNISGAQLSTDGTNYYDFGNASGNIPVSNGTVNTNLNADKLDGLDALATGASAHVLATDASGDISVVDIDASGYIELGTNPAGAGQIRIPNVTWLAARNAANSADVNLISANASNQVAFGADVAGFTAAGNITGSGSNTISNFATINGATISGGTLSGGTLSGGTYSGTSMTPATLTTGDGVSYTYQPVINVPTPGVTGYTALKVDVTESSVGTGTKNLLDLAVGEASKFIVDSTGQLTTGIIPGTNVSGNIPGDAANVTGIVTTTHGGTGANLSAGAQGGVTYMAASSTMAVSAAGTSGQVLQSNTTGAPTWTTDISGNAANVTGTVLTTHGGTGLTTYTQGDMPYYASGTALSKLGIGTANKVLTSSGTAPQWSESLTLAGTLSVTGSGDSSFTNGRVGIGITNPAAPLDVVKTYTTASATDYGAIVEPTYNVATTGSNKYTAFLVKATETNLAGYGSNKLLLDLQAGSTPASKFTVDNAGNITQAAGATINNQTIGATTSLAAVNVSGTLQVGGGYTDADGGLTIDAQGNISFDGDLYLKGVVYRPTFEELRIQNQTITLNAGATTDLDATIQVEKSAGIVSYINWDWDKGYWEFDKDVNLVTGEAYKINNTSVLSATTLGSGVVNSSLESVGTIGTGTWQGTKIGVAYGGTNLASYAVGDLIYASGATTLAKLADVAQGSVLVSGGVGAAPSYSTSPTLSGALTVQGAGDSSFVGSLGIGTTSPSALLNTVKSYTDTTGTVTQVAVQPTFAPTTGTAKLVGLNIAPVINQTGTATGDYTALQVYVTETVPATGTNKLLADFRLGEASKAKIDSSGYMTVQKLTIGSVDINSSTSASEGATLVGTNTSDYTNFTPASGTVQAALEAIDTSLGAISGGTGSFTSLTVTGTSDLQGAISNTSATNAGAVTIADAITQTGSGQVTFGGNVDANAGLDVTGALNLAGGTTYKVTATGDATLKDLNVATLTASGNIETTAGTITAANGLTVSASGASITGGVDNNSGGITEAGAISGASTIVASSTITQLKSVGLIPEYDNATPMGDSTDNFGTLSLKYDSTNYHNYYEWTTNEPAAQDYDIVVRYRLPDGFSSFDATTPIRLFTKSSDYSDANTKVVITMKDSGGNTVNLNGAGSVTLRGATTTGAWDEATITIGTPTVAFGAGQYVTLIIKLSASQGDTIDIGELTLKGNW